MEHLNRSGPCDDETPFHQFFELAPDGVVVAEVTGPIVLVNQQIERLFGYSRDELLSMEIVRLLPTHSHVRRLAQRQGYAQQPHLRPMGIGRDMVGLRKDGTEFPVEMSLSLTVFHGVACDIIVIRDVTEQLRLEREARQAREALSTLLVMAEERRKLLQFVLDELPGGVYLTRGPDARLVLANYAAEAVWGARWPIGRPMREFLASSGVRILSPEGRPLGEAELATVRAARTGEPIHHQQEIIRRPDGLTLPVLLNAVALNSRLLNWEPHNPGGIVPTTAMTVDGSRVAGYAHPPHAADGEAPIYASLVVLQDITGVKDAERLKDEFITMAAHELKTPMAVVRGYAEMLARDLRQHSAGGNAADRTAQVPESAEWRRDALIVIDDATQRLVELVDDLLDVTRMQANQLNLRLEPHDLVALARRVIRRAQVTTARHTITLRATEAHIVVTVDQVRIEQTLGNLLSNGIKYSPGGGEIIVEITGADTAEPTATDGAQPLMVAQVRIRDTGIGIPSTQQGRIFGRFARAENAKEQGIGGVGLGLYLCRELVERHGGHIWFESNEGQGTTFFVTLPLASGAGALA